jgi:translation initiation factor 1
MAKRKRDSGDGLVYSTDHGRMCPDCGHPVDDCACNTIAGAVTGDGRVRVRRESKGRKGKTVTVVEGLALDPFALADLAKELKQRCGSGGTAKDGRIEIQGDHVELVVDELRARGHDAKRAGG